MPPIDDLVRAQVTDKLDKDFQSGGPVNLANLTNIDPFGSLAKVEGPTLGAYDFADVTPQQAGSFFTQMDLLEQSQIPDAAAIAPHMLHPNPDSVHQDIPRLQHSIWVGQPLNGDSDKKRAFMDQLVKNQTDNANWQVVLWTDQPRERFHKNPPDNDIVEMKAWAEANRIKLASIDEIFGDRDNQMQLHMERRLEQNKSGTGRAAASDIIRLEVLNRFGGVYVDGDKPFKKPLDNIVDQAAAANITLGGHQVNGFVSAREGNNVQNCALCAKKDSEVTGAILTHIGAEYAKSRTELTNLKGTPVEDVGRPQRIEIIKRSGPSAIAAVTQGAGLMDADSLQSFTGTTSWSQEEPYVGYKQVTPAHYAAELSVTDSPRIDLPNELNHIKANAPQLPALPATDLNDEQNVRIGQAVRGGLTALCYTVANEHGRLDLKHLAPHLSGLTPEEKQLAVHATISALATPAFKGVRDQVNNVAIPSDMGVTAETMNLLTDNANFPKVSLDTFCAQRAALHGDRAMLRYAAEQNAGLNVAADKMVDAGTLPGADLPSGKYTPLMAAVHGGQTEAVKFLLAHSHQQGKNVSEAEFKDQMIALELAGQRGQTKTMVAIVDVAAGHIQGLNEPEKTTRQTALTQSTSKAFENLAVQQHVDFRMPKTAAEKGLNSLPSPANLPGLNDLATAQGRLEAMNDEELKKELRAAHTADVTISRLTALGAPGGLKDGMKKALTEGAQDKAARTALNSEVQAFTAPNLLTRMNQVPGMQTVVAAAAVSAFDSALTKRNGAAVKALLDGGFTAEAADPEKKRRIGESLARATDHLGGPAKALECAGQMGVEVDYLKAAASQEMASVLTASLNRQRVDAGDEPIQPGDFDIEAENAIAHQKFPNSEVGKNRFNEVTAATAPTMTAGEVRELAQTALVYSHDRLRADSKGSSSRVDGWSGALNQLIQNNPAVQQDIALKNLLEGAKTQIEAVNHQDKSVRNNMRTTAKDQGGPDLSQREGTSTAGKVRDLFKAPPPPVRSQTPSIPGKRPVT